LSEIALIVAPANFKGAGPRKKWTNFDPCLVAPQMETFVEVIPTRTNVSNLDTLNFASIFGFFCFPLNFHFWTNFKVWPISCHLAKNLTAIGRESSEISGLNAKTLPQTLFGGGPRFWDYRCLSAHIFDHVSNFRGDRPKQLGDIAPQNAAFEAFKVITDNALHKSLILS